MPTKFWAGLCLSRSGSTNHAVVGVMHEDHKPARVIPRYTPRDGSEKPSRHAMPWLLTYMSRVSHFRPAVLPKPEKIYKKIADT